MYRLGLQLAVKGGREALARLLVTALAVAIGVTILLGVFADFHAFQKTSGRPSWESTTGTAVTSIPGSTAHALLWHYSENIYKGQFIEQLDVSALGPNAPMLPGISKLPGAGQYYASPALARLLKTVPKDELGDRFPGTQVGTIGQAALSYPSELAIYVGRSPSQFAGLSGSMVVTHIATAPQLQGTTNMYREAFGIAALAILFPLLILINTATRLSATRREERYAAMRLIGATPHQINIIASVDAILGSLIGSLLGVAIFLLIRPAIANISLSGVKFFASYVTPTLWGYVGMVVIVPIIAAIASLISLRRVQISPLGVSRKTTPRKPKAWGLIPLIAGIILFPYGATNANGNKGGGPGLLFLGFLLIMVGITLSGSWLTMQITQVLARFARSVPALLAARRLSDNPKRAYRTISGIVLAVFIGSFISVLIPALNYAQNPSGNTSLSNVLRVPYNTGPGAGLPAQQSTALLGRLHSYAGTTVLPIYVNPAFQAFIKAQQLAAQGGNPNKPISINATQAPDDGIIRCANLKELPALGSCAPGQIAATFNADNILGGDNPLFIYNSLPMITRNSSSAPQDLQGLELAGLLIQTSNANTLEQVRTYLTTYNAGALHSQFGDKGSDALSDWQMGGLEPETLGEVAEIRNNDDTNVGRAVLAVVALTLVTAGCSLAVSVGGSLVERKRAFTLLRVSGVSIRTLYATVLLEAALPLIIASAMAAAIGIGVGIPVIKTLLSNILPKNASVPVRPTADYYLTLGIGLVVALVLVVITLPLLSRMTRPEEARFE